MDTWIEEAERRLKLKENILTEEEKRLEKNRQDNEKQLAPFLETFRSLIDRVAKIKPEERAPSEEVGYTFVKDEFRYEFYGSAFIEDSNAVLGKPEKIQCWHRIHFRVSDKAGLAKVNIYEKYTANKRGQKKEPFKSKYIFKIKDLTEEKAMNFLSWIVFRIPEEEMRKNLPRAFGDKKSGKDKRCYIATAVYADTDEYKLETLRFFRDEILTRSIAGKVFIGLYYSTSPYAVRVFSGSSFLTTCIRKLIVDPAFRIAHKMLEEKLF